VPMEPDAEITSISRDNVASDECPRRAAQIGRMVRSPPMVGDEWPTLHHGILIEALSSEGIFLMEDSRNRNAYLGVCNSNLFACAQCGDRGPVAQLG